MSQSVASLNALTKYCMPENPNFLIPDNVKLYKMLPDIKETERLGRKFLMPCELAAEGGVTYGDGTAFAYESEIDSVWDEAQIDASPVVLNMKMSHSVIDRLLSVPKSSFITAMNLRVKSIQKELARRAETGLFYGKSPSGLGTILNTTGSAGTSLVVEFNVGQWAPGTWTGRRNHKFEIRTPAGAGVAGHTTNSLVLASVNFVTKKATFTGDATEIAAVAANDILYFRGSYTNDMFGLDAILTTDGSVFGINNTNYELWRGSRQTLASNDFSEFIKAMGFAVANGGLDEDTIAFINSTKWEKLNSTVTNQNYRNFNGNGANNAAAKAGVKALTFTTQAGETTLIGSPYIKEGDGFVWSMKQFHIVGAKKISFAGTKDKEDYWQELPSNYGAMFQGSYEFAPYLEKPAQALKLTIPA